MMGFIAGEEHLVGIPSGDGTIHEKTVAHHNDCTAFPGKNESRT
jgi:hypothetical protein